LQSYDQQQINLFSRVSIPEPIASRCLFPRSRNQSAIRFNVARSSMLTVSNESGSAFQE
jgi:hypothetical protein